MPLRTAVVLLRCTHPEPSFAVTALATTLAIAAGRGLGSAWVAAAVLSGQFSVGWGNDLLDMNRDRVAGRQDKPLATGEIDPVTVSRAAIAAFALAVVLSLVSGLAAAAAHVLALLLAHAYNHALKNGPWSVVPYAVAFAMLPVFVTLGLGSRAHLPAWWAVLAAAMIGAAAHFTQTLPDLGRDAATGVRGLPQRMGARPSLLVVGLLLSGGALVAALGPGGAVPAVAVVSLGVTLALALAVLVAGAAGRYLAAFRLTLAAAAGAVATFLLTGRPL